MNERLVKHLFLMLLATGVSVAVTFSPDAKAFDKGIQPVILVKPEQYSPRTSLEEGYLIKPPGPETIFTPPIHATAVSRLSSLNTAKSLEKPIESDLIKILKQLYNKQEFTVADGRKAVEQASPEVACTIYYEAGRKTKYFEAYDPYILDGPDIDHAFNYGIGQLSPDGKLIEFSSLGYDNPFDPYQVVAYMNDAFVRAQQWAWGPTALGLC